MPTGTRSFCTSKDSFLTRLGCVASVPASVISSVWPSPGALATKSAPTLPDELGLFSTMTGWPIASDSFGADQARQNVGRAARRVGNDDRDLLGEVLSRARLRRK